MDIPSLRLQLTKQLSKSLILMVVEQLIQLNLGNSFEFLGKIFSTWIFFVWVKKHWALKEFGMWQRFKHSHFTHEKWDNRMQTRNTKFKNFCPNQWEYILLVRWALLWFQYQSEINAANKEKSDWLGRNQWYCPFLVLFLW